MLNLDPIASRTRQLDMCASVLTAAVLAVLELGPAIAKKAFNASDAEVALMTMGQGAGMLLTFWTAHLASRHSQLALVFWPELLARCVLVATFFVQPGFALVYVLIHALAQTLQLMTMPARISVYRFNYPPEYRGRIVGRNRQLQLITTAILALLISEGLEACLEGGFLHRSFGMDVVPAVRLVIPIMATIGVAGSAIFRFIPIRAQDRANNETATSLKKTTKHFVRIWREDHRFRRYQIYFCTFGFANIMSIPLTQIHAVDFLDADYPDMALINVVLVQGVMALTMPFWGRKLDRHSPLSLRAILNLFAAADYLIFAIAPTISWVYFGRVFRGIAFGGGSLVWMLGSLHFAKNRQDVPIYLGIHSVLTGARWLVAPALGVFMKKLFADDARPVFVLSATIMIVCAFLMLRDVKREKNSAESQ